MFGLVTASVGELTEEQKRRYNGVYCGICRQIRIRHSQIARLGLQYDMAFLALLHMSLYEPAEQAGDRACLLHPVKPRPWVDCESIRYAADMNVALAYYKCMDDWQDDRDPAAWALARALGKQMPGLEDRYPRQCAAIRDGIRALAELEAAGHPEPDLPANAFGRLMGELLVCREDLWAEDLRQLGFYLGRFIYLADAVMDREKDLRRGSYNPLPGDDPQVWENYLVMAMGRCCEHFQRLPLVQDKAVLDNILYSGVWVRLKQKNKRRSRG